MVMEVQIPKNRHLSARMKIRADLGPRNGQAGAKKDVCSLYQIVEENGLFVVYHLKLDLHGDKEKIQMVDIFDSERLAEMAVACLDKEIA